MGTDFSNKRIKCAVCGKDYNLSDFRCPKCDYPALAFSNKAAKVAVRIDNYKLKKGYKKPLGPNTSKSSKTQITNTEGDSVKQAVPQNRNQTATANTYDNKSKKTRLPWLIVIIAIIGIAAFIRFNDSNKPEDDTTSDVAESETVANTTETSSVPDNAEDAFQQFIDETITYADDYDEGHPVYYDSNGIDTITWEAYGIEDFDNDGDIELLALRSFYRIGGKLTLYEFENGDVQEGRSSWFLGGLEDLQNVVFYSNGVGFLHYGTAEDNEHTEYVYLFNDRYTNTYEVDSEQYLVFRHAEDGSIGFNTGPDYKGDDKILSQSEYDDFTRQLHFDEDNATYWMLSPEFTEIKQ